MKLDRDTLAALRILVERERAVRAELRTVQVERALVLARAGVPDGSEYDLLSGDVTLPKGQP